MNSFGSSFGSRGKGASSEVVEIVTRCVVGALPWRVTLEGIHYSAVAKGAKLNLW